MEGTHDPATSLIVTDRYGRQVERTLTREEWPDGPTTLIDLCPLLAWPALNPTDA